MELLVSKDSVHGQLTPRQKWHGRKRCMVQGLAERYCITSGIWDGGREIRENLGTRAKILGHDTADSRTQILQQHVQL